MDASKTPTKLVKVTRVLGRTGMHTNPYSIDRSMNISESLAGWSAAAVISERRWTATGLKGCAVLGNMEANRSLDDRFSRWCHPGARRVHG